MKVVRQEDNTFSHEDGDFAMEFETTADSLAIAEVDRVLEL